MNDSEYIWIFVFINLTQREEITFTNYSNKCQPIPFKTIFILHAQQKETTILS